MSGRGRGKFQRNRGNGKSSGKSNSSGTQKQVSYIFKVGTSKSAVDFEEIKEHVVNKMQTAYGIDVAKSIRDGEEVAFTGPRMKVSTNPDDKVKAAEDDAFKAEYRSELDSFIKKREKFRESMAKVYSTIYSQHCDKQVQYNIKALKDFKTKIQDNPIALMEAIKMQVLNYQNTTYHWEIVAQSLSNLLNTKMDKNEDLHAYLTRFQAAKLLLDTHAGGPIVIMSGVEKNKNYKKGDINSLNECAKEGWDRLAGFLLLQGSDQSRFGEILKTMRMNKLMDEEKYPLSVEQASQMLVSHLAEHEEKKPAARPSTSRGNGQQNQQQGNRPIEVPVPQCCARLDASQGYCKSRYR